MKHCGSAEDIDLLKKQFVESRRDGMVMDAEIIDKLFEMGIGMEVLVEYCLCSKVDICPLLRKLNAKEFINVN